MRSSSLPLFAALAVSAGLLVSPAHAMGHLPAQGCNPGLPVTANAAGRPVRTHEPLPMVCVTTTGYPTSETTIGVTPRGTVLVSPAQSENLSVRSTDKGGSWALTAPATEQYTSLWNTVDPNLTVDRRSGRIYLVHATGPTRTAPVVVDSSPLPNGVPTALAAAAGFQVYSSGDDGRTWTTADYESAPMGDWEKVFVGRSRAGAGSTVYVCGNSPFEVSGPGRICYRSHDEGRTFAVAGYVFPSAQEPKSCPALAANNGSVGPDGTIYQPVSCSDGSYVAVSTDEGSSYLWHSVPGTAGTGTGISGQSFQLAADGGGKVWASWTDGDRLMLTSSRDGGSHWATAANVAVPGAHAIQLAQLATGQAGQVGLAYYAAAATGQSRLTAWITQTDEGNTARPVFISGALTDPKHPTFSNYGLSGPSPRADYVGAAFDGQGQLWAAMVRQTSAPRPDGTIGTIGLVGHLEQDGAGR
ncbi:MAG: hypothetical protein JWO88_1932 [Frankiales bacterium]|nr:hypothetical protein [Frankiales bacterium]